MYGCDVFIGECVCVPACVHVCFCNATQSGHAFSKWVSVYVCNVMYVCMYE